MALLNFKYPMLCILCSVLLLTGCHPDYQTKLPNGYILVRTNASSTKIFPPNNPNDWGRKEGDIPSDITQIAIKGDIVFGLAQYSPHSDEESSYSKDNYGQGSVGGLFILDTKKCEAKIGMRRKEFIAELKKRNIINNDSMPSMKRPRRI